MNIIFNWCKVFFEKQTNKDINLEYISEEIFSLEIQQNENQLAIAKVTLSKQYKDMDFFDKYKYASISVVNGNEVYQLFRGKVIKFPLSFDPHLITIEFLAEYINDDLVKIKNECSDCYNQYYDIENNAVKEVYEEKYNKKFTQENIKLRDEVRLVNENQCRNNEVISSGLIKDASQFINKDSSVDNNLNFIKADVFHKIQLSLNAKGKLLHFNKATGEVLLSDIHRGRKQHVIFIKDLFKCNVHIKKNPLQMVNVKLSIKWNKQQNGIIDLGQHIFKQYGVLHSYNDLSYQIQTLTDYKKNDCYKFLDTTVHVEKNDLDALRLSVKDENNELKNIQLTRYKVNTNIPILWEMNQLQNETISFSIVNTLNKCHIKHSNIANFNFENVNVKDCKSICLNNMNYINNEIKDLHFLLTPPLIDIENIRLFMQYFSMDIGYYKGKIYQFTQDLCFANDYEIQQAIQKNDIKIICDEIFDSSRQSFFASEIGKKTIIHAYKNAISFLNFSNRCIQIEIDGSFSQLFNVSLDDEIILVDDFSDKKIVKIICAKISSLKFIMDGVHKIARLQLSCGFNSIYEMSLEAFYHDFQCGRVPVAHLGNVKKLNVDENNLKKNIKINLENPHIFEEGECQSVGDVRQLGVSEYVSDGKLQNDMILYDEIYRRVSEQYKINQYYDDKNISQILNLKSLNKYDVEECLPVEYFIDKVDISNLAEYQERFLKQIDSQSDIDNVLNKIPTKIKCRLRNLKQTTKNINFFL